MCKGQRKRTDLEYYGQAKVNVEIKNDDNRDDLKKFSYQPVIWKYRITGLYENLNK